MHLDCRKRNRLQRVQNCDAGVRVGGGIDHNAVKHAVSLLDFIHNCAFVVRLEHLAVKPRLPAGVLAERFKRSIVLRAVNCRFAQPQKIEVRSVDNQDFHSSASSMAFTHSEIVPSLAALISENCS